MLMDDIEVKVYRSGIKIPVIFFVPATILLTVYVLLYLLVNSQLFLDEALGNLGRELPGTFRVTEFVVSPTFTDVQLWNVEIDDRDGETFLWAERVQAGIDPLSLLARRIDVEYGIIDRATFDMKFAETEEGRMNLLDALGLEDAPDTPEDENAEALIRGVNMRNLSCNNCSYSFWLDIFDFRIPDVTIPNAELDISSGSLLIRAPELEVERADFEFRHWLFYFPEEMGNWRFTVEDFRVKDWAWAGDGFVVDEVEAEIGGLTVSATGQMAFPRTAKDEDQRMTYRARGRIALHPWNRTGQYFVDDLFHADARSLDIRIEGTMDRVDAETEFDIGVLDAYGLQVTDIGGTAVLNDEIVSIDSATGRVHGGDVAITDAWFDMFEGRFGGSVELDGVDPAGVTRDFGFDYPYLEGRASGALSVVGQIEYNEEYGRETSPYVMFNQFLDPAVEIELARDVSFVRTGALDTLPGRSFRIRKGARIWATPDRVGIEDAKIFGDHFELDVDDFVFDWERYELLESQFNRRAKIRLETNSLAQLLRDYDASGLDGRLVATLDPVGLINFPTTGFDVRVSNPRLTVGGVEIDGEKLHATGSIDEGRLVLDAFDFESESGSAAVDGFIDILRDPTGLKDENGELETDFLSPSRHAARFEVNIENLDLAAAESLAGLELDLQGRANGRLELRETIEDPEASFEVSLSDASILGQKLRRADVTGEIADRSWQVRRVVVDAGPAGKLEGWANIGFDDSIAFEARGDGIDLASIAPLKESGVQIEGDGDFYFHGEGTLDAPEIGGDARVNQLKVADRALGDLALVANTVGDTTHLVGALLPWVTVNIEIPLDTESAYYARFGIDHLDVVDAVPELQRVRVLEEAEATGTIEVFLEPGFERYQVLANLSEVRAVALDKTFRNEGAIIAGLNNGELFQIQQATIGTEGRMVSMQGGIFLDEALLDLQLSGDLDLSLLTGFRLSFPEFFPETFLESTGVATVDASVKGTPGLIVADGFVDFGRTEVLLRDVSDPLDIVSGRVLFDRGGISIDPKTPLRGRILGGVFSATGDLGLDGMTPRDLRAKIWTHNMSYRLPQMANLTFDTELRLSAPDLDRPATWELAGNIDILDGLYYESISIFQEQLTNRVIGAFSRRTERYEASLLDQFPSLEEMSFDLAIRARDGFKIESEIDRLALDLELRVDVRLQNTLTNPRLNGDIDVIDGRVTFQGQAFDVRTGTLSFFGDADNPSVDIVADADIFNTCRDTDVTADVSQTMSLSGVVDTEERKSYHVTLNVQGALDTLNIQFESIPYADQRDILSLLLTGCTVDQITASSASSPTLEVALGPVLGWIEGQVQDVVEVEEFTITPSVDRLKATVGDSLSRRVSWRLQLDTGLTEVATGQRLQLEYKLSDRWSAQASESSTESSQFDSFLVDFKLKYRILLD